MTVTEWGHVSYVGTLIKVSVNIYVQTNSN